MVSERESETQDAAGASTSEATPASPPPRGPRPSRLRAPLRRRGAWWISIAALVVAVLAFLIAVPRVGSLQSEATRRLQEIYAEPVDPDLIGERIAQIKDAGVTCAVAVTPHRTLDLADAVLRAEPDLLVIQGAIVSAEHVARSVEPLNLKAFIRHYEIPVLVGGCTSYQAALHLMRTGAAGVLVGAGTGATGVTRDVLGVGVPHATALADARAARMRHLDETGVYCHVIADGGVNTGGDIARAVACGADAVLTGTPFAAATEAPGRGWHWSMPAVHATLPRGERIRVEPRGTLEQILHGPAHDATGAVNLTGALRRAMALCGFETLKDLQLADLVTVGGH